ncbi:MAG: phosphoribosylamine--glycine ligase [Rhodospirillaceae bacterium TMED8]|nr:phosphoribosylamine--glycine ligase [Magnetovibrio sp.]OUT52215.1 MAG: phosphoribosylamine--glycine ligase [Rhodospirillaceae bacterium TMED8]|tara:strand:+ start:5420 stop:6709 length:1290 start_codon:yes stop_codon:yes gene_type:complete
MRVLVVGSGGREHALTWAIAKSPRCSSLYCAPGNGGITNIAECVDIKADDIDAIVAFAKEKKIDFVVIGPEGPLVMGLADQLTAAGITAFGPSAGAAMIEGSKARMKDLCAKYDIPTAQYACFKDFHAAKAYIDSHGAPIVVKADGLAGGKGVILCHTKSEAYAAINQMMIEKKFKNAGGKVVIEEFMEGEEASFFALLDGKIALPLASAQDHKAAFDGDKGPNTGGMGAYTPAPILNKKLTKEVMETIIEPTIIGMAKEGTPFKGVLYAGLMITENGPKLIEYNCRFGDPECQPLMMRLKSDALEILLAAAEGRLDSVEIEWHKDAALSIVMAARGYPGMFGKGSEITGIKAAEKIRGVTVFHAGTRVDGDRLIAIGGRVLNVTAIGCDIAEAQKNAYKAIRMINWKEGFYRTDIGWRAVKKTIQNTK